MHNRIARAVSVILATAIIVMPGCSAPYNDARTPGTSPAHSMSLSAPRTAPPVKRTLDIRSYLDQPCRLLSVADLAVIGFGNDPHITGLTQQCLYEADVASKGALLLKLDPDQSPLKMAYANDSDRYELFEPLEILGQPGVAQAETSKVKGCALLIGTDQDQGVALLRYPDQGEAPDGAATVCAQLEVLAETVLRKIGA